MLTDAELREIEERLAMDPLGDGGSTMTITNNETGEKSTSVQLSDAQRLLAEVKELRAENIRHLSELQRLVQKNNPGMKIHISYDRETKKYLHSALYKTEPQTGDTPTLQQAKSLPTATRGTYTALAADDPRSRLILDWYNEKNPARPAKTVAVTVVDGMATVCLNPGNIRYSPVLDVPGTFKDASAALDALCNQIKQEKEAKS